MAVRVAYCAIILFLLHTIRVELPPLSECIPMQSLLLWVLVI